MPQGLQDEKRAMISLRNNGKDSMNKHSDGSQKTTIDHRNKIENGVNGDGSGGGGGGNSAEDEGISSSEQDDCEDDVLPPVVITRKDDDIIVAINGVGGGGGGGGGYNKKASYGLSSSQGGGGGGTVTTTTVDGVLKDFDKVINDASTEFREGRGGGIGDRHPSSASSRGCADDRVLYPRRHRYYSSSGRNDGGSITADDVIIVPTKIVPEPPRRSRSLFVNKNFEVNPFFEDEEDDEDEEEDESGADSECAYEDEEDDDVVDNKCGSRITKCGGSADETFHSVQKQIERFSALALRRGGGPTGDHDILQRCRDEDEIKADLLQHGGGGGKRKSIYDVFAGVERPVAMTYGCGGTRVTRSASTRNAVDPRTPVIPRFVNHCVGSNKPVYLPGGRGDATTDGSDPKTFVATRTNGVGNNAGLYSGYKDPTVTLPKCVGFSAKSASNGSGSSSSKEGPKALHRVNLSVSTGKLTDFPSGLY